MCCDEAVQRHATSSSRFSSQLAKNVETLPELPPREYVETTQDLLERRRLELMDWLRLVRGVELGVVAVSALASSAPRSSPKMSRCAGMGCSMTS